jgi:hypothetical protein
MRYAVLAFLVAGCGGASMNTDGGGAADMAVRPAAADLAKAPGDGPEGPCNDPEKDRPKNGVCVAFVRGKIVDDAGTPVAKKITSVCGSACFFGESGADGTFVVEVRTHIDLGIWALNVHGRPDYAGYYVQLPKPVASDVTFGALPLLALPKSGPLLALDKSAQKVTSNDVTLSLPAGADVNLDVEDVELKDAGRQFRALAADPKKAPFVDGAVPPEALYGFSPFEVLFTKPGTLSFPNPTKAAEGTKFDVLALRTLLTTLDEPSGTWKRVAGATVKSGRIEMDPGDGVTFLTWIALKRK